MILCEFINEQIDGFLRKVTQINNKGLIFLKETKRENKNELISIKF
jgi:hypothetical protein